MRIQKETLFLANGKPPTKGFNDGEHLGLPKIEYKDKIYSKGA